MELPDQIEEVNAKILEKIVHDTGYVAVLFCKNQRTKFLYLVFQGPDFWKTKRTCWIARSAAMQKERKSPPRIGEYRRRSRPAGHRFCQDRRWGTGRRIQSDISAHLGLLPEQHTCYLRRYNDDKFKIFHFKSIKAVEFFIPFGFTLTGDLLREEDVLEWLVQNKNTASEEEDMIEDVTAKTLETLTSTAPHLAVLFCKLSYFHVPVAWKRGTFEWCVTWNAWAMSQLVVLTVELRSVTVQLKEPTTTSVLF